jgi:adenosylcobinamide-phosphate synthase
MIAGIQSRNFSEVFIKTLRNRRKTDSPNAGWTMAALASLLDIRLEKKGSYVINDSGREPNACDITACIKICRTASLLIMILFIIAGIMIYGI